MKQKKSGTPNIQPKTPKKPSNCSKNTIPRQSLTNSIWLAVGNVVHTTQSAKWKSTDQVIIADANQIKIMEELTKYILKGGFRLVNEGISIEKALTFEQVLSKKVLKNLETSHTEATMSEIQVRTESGNETWYACEFGWGAGDDADDWVELHESKQTAEKNYNDFIKI